MGTAAPEDTPATGGGNRWRAHDLLLAALAVTLLVARYPLLASINVNWDEFQFLSRVHEFDRGELATAFQTFHVRLFGWLTAVKGHELDQVIAGRRVMFALTAGSSAMVFLLALRLASRTGALVAVVGTLTFSYLLRHGEAFRADPLISFLFLLAATLLVWRPGRARPAVAAGVALALAASISVKTAIYTPAIVGIAAIQWWSARAGPAPDRGRDRLLAAIALGVAMLLTYALLQLWHAAAVAAPGTEVVRNAVATGSRMVGEGEGQRGVFVRSLRWDWAFWLLAACGALLALRDAWRLRADVPARTHALIVLSLLLPLLSLEFYRNSFQYFYVTIVPLGSLAIAYAVARLERSAAQTSWLPAAILLLAAPMMVQGARSLRPLRAEGTAAQRQVLDAVHAIFGEPVPYLDRCGMVATFPRVNRFMSTYVMAAYRRQGVPEMARVVAERQPRFLLANVAALELDRSWRVVAASGHRLLPEDFEFLQRHFVHHWGPIWVPGVRVVGGDDGAGGAPPGRTMASSGEAAVTIVVGGAYTVEASGPVEIDGARAVPGDVVTLQPGTHRVKLEPGVPELTLRHGSRLPRPTGAPPTQALFHPL